MTEHFRGDRSRPIESESGARQKDIDFLYAWIMKKDTSTRGEIEAQNNNVQEAEMRLMLPLAREAGIQVHEPRCEWDDIILDRPKIAENTYARVVLHYGIDARDRVRELYEERTESLSGELVVTYSIEKKYAKKPEKLREPSWHPDNQFQDVTETLVPTKEIYFKASKNALDALNNDRKEQLRQAMEREARYQAFFNLLQQQSENMPLLFSPDDVENNRHNLLFQGLKEFVSDSFFKQHRGLDYGFRIQPENDYFVIEAYFKKTGYVDAVYPLTV